MGYERGGKGSGRKHRVASGWPFQWHGPWPLLEFHCSTFRIWFSCALIIRAWQLLFCEGRLCVLHRKKWMWVKKIRSMTLHLSITMFSHRLKMWAQPGSNFSLIQTPGLVLACTQYPCLHVTPQYVSPGRMFLFTLLCHTLLNTCYIPLLRVTAFLGWVKGFLYPG